MGSNSARDASLLYVFCDFFSGQEALGDLPSGVAKLISVASLCFWILYLPSPDRYGSSIVRSHGWSSWHEGTDAVQDVKVFFFVKERKRWIIIHHPSSSIYTSAWEVLVIEGKTPSYKKPECLVDRLYSTPPGGAVLVNEWRVFGAIWWHAQKRQHQAVKRFSGICQPRVLWSIVLLPSLFRLVDDFEGFKWNCSRRSTDPPKRLHSHPKVSHRQPGHRSTPCAGKC